MAALEIRSPENPQALPIGDVLTLCVDPINENFDAGELGEKVLSVYHCKCSSHWHNPCAFDVERRSRLAHIRMDHNHVAHLGRIMECHPCRNEEPQNVCRLIIRLDRWPDLPERCG